MEKRGQLVYKALISVIASAIVVAAFITAGKSYGNQEAYYKAAVARDIALLLDTIISSSGDVEYTYPNDVSKYLIEVKDNVVRVYDYNFGKTDPVQASFRFAGGKQTIDSQISGLNYINIRKMSGKIEITGIADSAITYEGKNKEEASAK